MKGDSKSHAYNSQKLSGLESSSKPAKLYLGDFSGL